MAITMRFVHFTFLALASLLCGWIVSSVTEGALQRPLSLAAPAPTWQRSAAAARGVEAARLNALLGLPPPSVSMNEASKLTAAKTPSPLVLLGTLSPSFAAVFDPVSKHAHTVAPGDVIGDDEIAVVNHRSILINREGRVIELSLNTPPAVVAAATAQVPANTTIARAELSHAMNSMPEIAQQIQIVPAFTNGEFRGFRVVRLTPGSLLARAGLMSGDVLRRVNGLELSKPENLGHLLASASSVTQVNLELDRNGAPMQWSVALAP